MLPILLDTINIPAYQQQEAWIWIPIIIAVGGGWLLKELFSTKTEPLKGNTLGILGMPGAGKTQFLRNLQGKPYTKYEQTHGAEEYKTFWAVIGERRIKIEQGKDIGGAEANIPVYYKDFLKQKDIVIFLFDLKKYLYDSEYRKKTNARFDFIYPKKSTKVVLLSEHISMS